MSIIRVILADDHPVVRTGIRTLLEQTADIEVVAETGNGSEVIELVNRYDPHVLLLDMEMPGQSGIEIAQLLEKKAGRIRILALSAHDDEHYIQGILAHGAAGYLTKEDANAHIVQAVRGVAHGETGWFSRRALAQLRTMTDSGEPVDYELSPREREVLHLLAAGESNRAIANALGIHVKTVEKHVSAILSKLAVDSRVEAAVLAVQEGLV